MYNRQKFFAEVLTLISLYLLFGSITILTLKLQNLIIFATIPLISFIISKSWGVLNSRIAVSFGIISYIIWLMKEIMISTFRVIKITWNSKLLIDSQFTMIMLKQKNCSMHTLLYANSITLTPGTVTLCVDNNKFLVHSLNETFLNDLNNDTMSAKIQKITN